MDIFIKSFNRPYYLDRCLHSIKTNVIGAYDVKILDDGTPSRYLDIIRSKYPEVDIIRSNLYSKKAAAIDNCFQEGLPFKHLSIPVELWIESINKASDTFLLLEDDFWIVQPFNIEKYRLVFEENKMVILKLFWAGNSTIIGQQIQAITDDIEEVAPNILPFTKLFLQDKFKIKSLLYKLKLIGDNYFVPAYSTYSVASAIFNKQYWLYLWNGAGQKVNESHQLIKALEWKQNNRLVKYGKTKEEFTKTSYITSATNNFDGIPIDIFRVNYHLNEAWLSGKLDAMANFPSDFKTTYLKKILDEAGDPNVNSLNWLKWVDRFKEIYISIGCEVE